LIKSHRMGPLLDLFGCEATHVLESRCNVSSGERRATSPKIFPLAADPSGASSIWCRPRAKMDGRVPDADLFTRTSPCADGPGRLLCAGVTGTCIFDSPNGRTGHFSRCEQERPTMSRRQRYPMVRMSAMILGRAQPVCKMRTISAESKRTLMRIKSDGLEPGAPPWPFATRGGKLVSQPATFAAGIYVNDPSSEVGPAVGRMAAGYPRDQLQLLRAPNSAGQLTKPSAPHSCRRADG